jgi:hypothetical protein
VSERSAGVEPADFSDVSDVEGIGAPRLVQVGLKRLERNGG